MASVGMALCIGFDANMYFDLHGYDDVSSTNDLVKAAIAEGAPQGYCVCAKRQTGGYGRRGNRWASEPGGLYYSLLLRPDLDKADEVATLSLAISIAVRRALARFLPAQLAECVKIKWPNDVVVDGGHTASKSDRSRDGRDAGPDKAKFNKICGISLECIGDAICIGIGINIDMPGTDIGDGFLASKNTPSYLNELLESAGAQKVAIEDVCQVLMCEISDVYGAWSRFGFGFLRPEYLQHFALRDLDIRVDDAGQEGPICGRAVDVSDKGHLIVKAECSDRLHEITSGTIGIR